MCIYVYMRFIVRIHTYTPKFHDNPAKRLCVLPNHRKSKLDCTIFSPYACHLINLKLTMNDGPFGEILSLRVSWSLRSNTKKPLSSSKNGGTRNSPLAVDVGGFTAQMGTRILFLLTPATRWCEELDETRCFFIFFFRSTCKENLIFSNYSYSSHSYVK